MALRDDPKTIFLPDPEYKRTFFGDYSGQIIFSGTVLITAAIVTMKTGRPLFSGIHRYPLYATPAWFLGGYFNEKREKYKTDHEALLRHYIETHPDDFPTPERKYVKDLLKPWIPIR